jgi:glucan-binding YG repeat protein
MATTTTSHAILGFTSHLRESLLLSRSRVETWVEHEKAQADAVYERSKQTRASHQHRIDQALTNLLALQLEGGLAVSETESTTKIEKNLAARKEELLREQEAVESEIASLAKKQAQRKAQLQELNGEREAEKAKVQGTRELKQRVQASKQTTLEDLTKGIVNYQYLGIDFQKAQDNHMKFYFTQLDPTQPKRQFSFLLQVDDVDDQYIVDVCDPPIPEHILNELLSDLNADDDMLPFVIGMRHAFKAHTLV